MTAWARHYVYVPKVTSIVRAPTRRPGNWLHIAAGETPASVRRLCVSTKFFEYLTACARDIDEGLADEYTVWRFGLENVYIHPLFVNTSVYAQNKLT